MTDAAKCRRNGWGPGTLLAGDEGYGVTVIKITAVGEGVILAKQVSQNGVPDEGSETTWTLDCRRWRKVKQASR